MPVVVQRKTKRSTIEITVNDVECIINVIPLSHAFGDDDQHTGNMFLASVWIDMYGEYDQYPSTSQVIEGSFPTVGQAVDAALEFAYTETSRNGSTS